MNVRLFDLRSAFCIVMYAALQAPAQASPGGCFVSCVKDRCSVGGSQFASNISLSVEACDDKALEAGQAIVSFRSHGKAAQVVASGAVEFKTLLARYAPIDCLSSQSRDKCKSAETSTGVILGKGFEGADSWRPSGDPCGFGLPCGTVSLGANGEPWRAFLNDKAASGSLRVNATRGQSAEISVPVVSGRFELPAGWLHSGQIYRYTFTGSGGPVIAAGDFSTLSANAQRDADQFLADARRVPTADRMAEVTRSLLEDGLDWEALQWALGARGQP